MRSRYAWRNGPWLGEPDVIHFRVYDLPCFVTRRAFDECLATWIAVPFDHPDMFPSRIFAFAFPKYESEAPHVGWITKSWAGDDTPLAGSAPGDYVTADNAFSATFEMARRLHFTHPARPVRQPGLHPVTFTDCLNIELVTMEVPYPSVVAGEWTVPLRYRVKGVDFANPQEVLDHHQVECMKHGRNPVWMAQEVEAARTSLQEIVEGLER